ncbi:hypothetical protein AB0G02_11200 [Actinosynnema sp. NPDC023658]|uniref:hypothetical protein n=1 Tax=Actinosynnema sp. NPDC023658 TaxID=3155465 RepID=UPI0033F69425
MIEALAQVVCTVIQVEAGAHGSSTAFRVQLPSGETTALNALDVRLNALGYSARQDLVYGVDERGRLVALDRSGRPVGEPTRPSDLLSGATAGVVVDERLVVRQGLLLRSVDIDPDSSRFGQVVHEVWMWPSEAVTVDDFDVNPDDGLLYGVSTAFGHGQVVTIDPDTGRTTPVPGAGRLPRGDSYGAVTLAPDGALYATNNSHGGRSTLWRVALDGSGVVTQISSGPAVRTIDSSGCLTQPPPTTTTTPTPTTTTVPTTTTTTPPTTTTTTTTPAPTTTTPAPTPTTTTTTTPRPTPPTTTTTVRAQPVVTLTTTSEPVVPPPPPEPPLNTPPPPPPPPNTPEPPPPSGLEMPDRRAETVMPKNHVLRDQRRWGLVALILIIGAAALARQAAARRR